MIAAQVGEPAVVKLLLEHCAEVNARDPDYGQTALMFAARAGHADIAALLIARGADLNAATRPGNPPAWVKTQLAAGALALESASSAAELPRIAGGVTPRPAA